MDDTVESTYSSYEPLWGATASKPGGAQQGDTCTELLSVASYESSGQLASQLASSLQFYSVSTDGCDSWVLELFFNLLFYIANFFFFHTFIKVSSEIMLVFKASSYYTTP